MIQAQKADDGFAITAVTKLKHADIWAAAKAVGGLAALARHLELEYSQVVAWASMKHCPAIRRWPKEKLDSVNRKLLALIGKTIDELFPDWLRQNGEFLRSNKTIERTKSIEDLALTNYAEHTGNRLVSACPSSAAEAAELSNGVSEILKTLSYREREIIRLRYGLSDGFNYTLEEVGHIFRVTRENIRRIEAKAIRKLQAPHRKNLLAAHLDDE